MSVRVAALVLLGMLVSLGYGTASSQGPAAASGDPVKGKAVFEQCIACHALDNPMPAGPSLKGVFGRKAGSRDDFRYSPAMTRSGIVWDATTLDAYLADPQGYIKGNRMTFAGVKEKADRDDLIAYLEKATRSVGDR